MTGWLALAQAIRLGSKNCIPYPGTGLAAEVNIETLRYYERRGLLAEPDHSPGGPRLYPTETVTALRVIKAAQRLRRWRRHDAPAGGADSIAVEVLGSVPSSPTSAGSSAPTAASSLLARWYGAWWTSSADVSGSTPWGGW